MQNKNIGLIGAGAQAREIADYVISGGGEIEFLAVQKNYLKSSELAHRLIDVNNPSEVDKLTKVVSAIGAPLVKKTLMDEWSGKEYGEVIADSSWVSSQDVKLGEGVVIAPGCQITTGVEIGSHVLVNVGVSINHDTTVGNYSTISPGVHIGGHVHIGEGAFIGIGATIKNNVRIESGVVVGAGAVVIENLEEPNGVYVGIPARLIRKNTTWLHEV